MLVNAWFWTRQHVIVVHCLHVARTTSPNNQTTTSDSSWHPFHSYMTLVIDRHPLWHQRPFFFFLLLEFCTFPPKFLKQLLNICFLHIWYMFFWFLIVFSCPFCGFFKFFKIYYLIPFCHVLFFHFDYHSFDFWFFSNLFCVIFIGL